MPVIPDHVSFQDAVLVEPLACVLRGVQEIGVCSGDTAVVIGCGPIGLTFVRVLSQRGVRVIALGMPDLGVNSWHIVLALSVLTMTVGNVLALWQDNVRRLLAYSSIANIGYALIGLSAGNQQGVQSMLMFMVFYMIDVTGFLACLIALKRDGRPMEDLAHVSACHFARARPRR